MLAVFYREFLEIVFMTKGSKVDGWEAPPFLLMPTRQELSMWVYGGASTVFSTILKLREYASMTVNRLKFYVLMKVESPKDEGQKKEVCLLFNSLIIAAL